MAVITSDRWRGAAGSVLRSARRSFAATRSEAPSGSTLIVARRVVAGGPRTGAQTPIGRWRRPTRVLALAGS